MKKKLIAAAIIGTLGLAGIQMASAQGGFLNSGYGHYGGTTTNRTLSEEDARAYEKFRTETRATQRELVVKKSELDALLRQDNPDERKVARLAGEIYDLEEQFQKKTENRRPAYNFADDHGPGMMWGNGSRRVGRMMGW